MKKRLDVHIKELSRAVRILYDNSNSEFSSEMRSKVYEACGLLQHDFRLEKVEKLNVQHKKST